MVMLFSGLLKARKGQSRILEAVIAAVIIFIVFSVSMFFIRASDVKVLQERTDLDRLGYNVLHGLVESGTIEATIEKYGSGFGEVYLKTVVQSSLPFTTYFNLTIFNCVDKGSWVELQPSGISISNTPDPKSFANSLEVSSTNMIYTSKKGNIYHLVLVLARAGGG